MPRPKTPPSRTLKTRGFCINDEEYKWAQETARAERLSFSALTRIALMEKVERIERENGVAQ